MLSELIYVCAQEYRHHSETYGNAKIECGKLVQPALLKSVEALITRPRGEIAERFIDKAPILTIYGIPIHVREDMPDNAWRLVLSDGEIKVD